MSFCSANSICSPSKNAAYREMFISDAQTFLNWRISQYVSCSGKALLDRVIVSVCLSVQRVSFQTLFKRTENPVSTLWYLNEHNLQHHFMHTCFRWTQWNLLLNKICLWLVLWVYKIILTKLSVSCVKFMLPFFFSFLFPMSSPFLSLCHSLPLLRALRSPLPLSVSTTTPLSDAISCLCATSKVASISKPTIFLRDGNNFEHDKMVITLTVCLIELSTRPFILSVQMIKRFGYLFMKKG